MPETVGQRLRAARNAKRLTLEKAAEVTRLRVHHLQALENDDYSVMSSAAQGRGFLRIYAAHLGLDLDQIIKEASVRDAPTLPETISAPVESSAATESSPLASPQPVPEAGRPPEPVAPALPARSGFWSRLLRRRLAEATPEPAAASTSETQESARAAQQIPEPESASVRKTRVTKPRAPKEKVVVEPMVGESDEAGSAPAPDKKKLTLNP